MCAICVKLARNQERAVFVGYVAQNRIPRAPIPPATPHFLWLPSLRIAQRATETLVLVLTWWSRRAARPAHGGGQRWVHQVPRAKESFFPKVFLDHLGCSNEFFLSRFEPLVARFGPWKRPKCLENGPIWDQIWVKIGSKMGHNCVFPNSHLGPFGMLKQVFLARFRPVVKRFGLWKIPKCLEKGPFWEQKWVNIGQNRIFPKVTLDHWGRTNKWN